MTSKPPETPHEKAFVQKYGSFIQNTMLKLKNPKDPSKPRENWDLLNQLQNDLANKLQAQTSLKLADVSPTLKEMDMSNVPMPGKANLSPCKAYNDN